MKKLKKILRRIYSINDSFNKKIDENFIALHYIDLTFLNDEDASIKLVFLINLQDIEEKEVYWDVDITKNPIKELNRRLDCIEEWLQYMIVNKNNKSNTLNYLND